MSKEMVLIVLVLCTLVVPVALVILASMRNDGMMVGHWLAKIFAWAFNLVGKMSKTAGEALRRQAGVNAAELTGDGNAVLAFISPLLFGLLFLLFAAAEVGLAILGWSALHHEVPPGWMANRTAILAAVASVSAASFWGLVALDVKSGRIRGPWQDMPLSSRRRVEMLAWMFAIASLVAFPLFYGWRELQIEAGPQGDYESLRRWLGFAIIVAFGAVIGAAALFSLWAVLDSLNVTVIAALAVIGWACAAIEQMSRSVIDGIDVGHALATGVYDWVVAGRGRTLWNWVCSFDFIGQRLHFKPIVFEKRPRIAPDF